MSETPENTDSFDEMWLIKSSPDAKRLIDGASRLGRFRSKPDPHDRDKRSNDE